MDATNLVEWIERHCRRYSPDYGRWYVGITDDSARRKQEHNRPACWLALPADSEQTARGVEKLFLARGMTGGPGGGGSGKYVYIY